MNEYLTVPATVFAMTFLLTVILESRAIPVLKRIAKQPIYTDGPAWHASKSGTPTMGGAAFIIAASASLISAIIFLFYRGSYTNAISLTLALSYSLTNAVIGVVDDVTKLRRRENAGLSPRQKLILQFISASIFLILRARLLGDDTSIHFSFGDIDLGVFYYPFSILMLLGIVNCANLTDGVDGLASSVAFAASAALLLLSLGGPHDSLLLCAATLGASLAFLIFNSHPAKIFMGDTGSLFLGAALVSCSFSLDNPTVMIPVGIVYVIEGISVIAQVVFFKRTGKRLFKMAPLHHHLEKCNVSENMICIISILTTVAVSVLAFLLL